MVHNPSGSQESPQGVSRGFEPQHRQNTGLWRKSGLNEYNMMQEGPEKEPRFKTRGTAHSGPHKSSHHLKFPLFHVCLKTRRGPRGSKSEGNGLKFDVEASQRQIKGHRVQALLELAQKEYCWQGKRLAGSNRNSPKITRHSRRGS
jgi:hypothetical protein